MGFLATYAPTAKFPTIGTRVEGDIVDARQIQTSDFKTKRPEYWEDKAKTFAPVGADGRPNDPKAQLEVTVETGIPDESGETERRLFIKNKRQFDALKAALKTARARQGLLIGGRIAMTWTGTEASDGGEDAKTWAIEYAPPAEGSAFGEVPEEVLLIGGGVWRRGQPTPYPTTDAIVERVSQAPPVAPPVAVPQTRSVQEDELTAARAEALARIQRAQASSPIARSLGINPAAQEEPPF